MKTKQVNVTLEIPENMEVSSSHQLNHNSVQVNLQCVEPKEILLREVIGATHIPSKYYYMKQDRKELYYNNSEFSYNKEDYETVYELVKDEC